MKLWEIWIRPRLIERRRGLPQILFRLLFPGRENAQDITRTFWYFEVPKCQAISLYPCNSPRRQLGVTV